ncbi:hypothetical protein GN956_G26467 [Arapaima gigas]
MPGWAPVATVMAAAVGVYLPSSSIDPEPFGFWLKGPKAGTKEILMGNMLAYPDVHVGTFLVGIAAVRFPGRCLPPFLTPPSSASR